MVLAIFHQSARPVIDRVHSRDDRQQHLGRADVARGFFALDMLLAGLDGQPIGGIALASLETPTMRPGILRACSILVAMNAACGPPKPIGTPKRWADPTAISAPNSPGGLMSVRASRSVAQTTSAPAGVRFFGEVAVIDDPAFGGRILDENAEEFPAMRNRRISHRPRRPRSPAISRASARRRWFADDNRRRQKMRSFCRRPNLASPAMCEAHGHRFGGGGAFIEQRRIGQRQAGEVAHHRLKIEQAPPAGLEQFPPGKACTACTSRDFQGCCVESPAA